MKIQLLTALIMSTLSVVSLAEERSLSGQILSCTYQTLSSEDISVDYVFFTGPKGEPKAARFSSLDGNEIQDYRLNGSLLTVLSGDGNKVYDLSRSPAITRHFRDCISAGQGGGGSRPLCGNNVEVCSLR